MFFTNSNSWRFHHEKTIWGHGRGQTNLSGSGGGGGGGTPSPPPLGETLVGFILSLTTEFVFK